MKLISKTLLGITLGLSVASAGAAENIALLVANTAYTHATRAPASKQIANSKSALEQAGYSVTIKYNLDHADLRQTLQDFAAKANNADRVIFAFTGHILHDEHQTYLAPVDLNAPNAASIGLDGFPLAPILAISAQHAGGAGVFLGSHFEKSSTFGRWRYGFHGAPGLSAGLGGDDIPQGVLVVTGRTQDLSNALRQEFLRPGQDIKTAVDKTAAQIQASGYISRFNSLAVASDGDQAVSPLKPIVNSELIRSYWETASESDTIESYLAFLNRFPLSIYEDRARARLKHLNAEALKSPEERAEQALELSRNQRRDIQKNLTLLGFNTRGVDGIFGPGSRGAIKEWQQAKGYNVSGFLSVGQITALGNQARAFANHQAQEAARVAAETRREDQAFWQLTGAHGGIEDLQVYLKKYPKGIYAQQARTNLANLQEEQAQIDKRDELRYWQTVQRENLPESYRDYLRLYPEGRFRDAAQDALDKSQMSDAQKRQLAQAQSRERALNMSTGSWKMVERRLDKLGLRPGEADGKVTSKTRRALKAYQHQRKLNATGYLDQDTLSNMILRSIFK
ncbi:peptidoglycan-binding protein [Amylibacter marinus]|uniref:Peptidoglycan-binding protein n=1 Tax=Amylibacter marinus TaxID=1475483 RepID=A0ABQ5VSV7_9RHOB|nr:peptidoglycan-binding protein [Amylibacter marinus]GLQ34198.1 peptidoglycan-binding protein [Amylibacter marinus]